MLLALIKKECLLLSRDLHGLLLLFVMPLIFVLIMSLALKDTFAKHSGSLIDVAVYDSLDTEDSRFLLKKLNTKNTFSIVPVYSVEELKEYNLGIEIHLEAGIPDEEFDDSFNFLAEDAPLMDVYAAPEMEPSIVYLLTSALAEARMALQVKKTRESLQSDKDAAKIEGVLNTLAHQEPAKVTYYSLDQGSDYTPNSVQQNVPAWLVFGMFFIVVPLANTLLSEQYAGTLKRLQALNVPSGKMVLGKVLPYFAINQLQAVLMFMIGLFVLPLVGADALSLGNSIWALLLITVSTSIAALGYALFIAAIVKSVEQATALGGVGNILLAALGGVMVPVFVMPDFMQNIAVVSPMYWAVEGFLDVMLRGGGVSAVFGESAFLAAFGTILLLFAAALLRRHRY